MHNSLLCGNPVSIAACADLLQQRIGVCSALVNTYITVCLRAQVKVVASQATIMQCVGTKHSYVCCTVALQYRLHFAVQHDLHHALQLGIDMPQG